MVMSPSLMAWQSGMRCEDSLDASGRDKRV